jgi:hypothetical protein
MQRGEQLAAALAHAAANLQRLPGREERKGLHEVNEPGPTLRTALQGIFPSGAHAKLRHRHAISDWTREDTEVDLVVLDDSGEVELSAQLKVWDIGHQLFDLAKIHVCSLHAYVRAS